MMFPAHLTACLLVLQSAGEPPKGWTSVTTKDNRYAFAMPAKPDEKVVMQKATIGPIAVIEYSCVANGCLYRWEKTPNKTGVAADKREGFLEYYGGFMAQKLKVLGQKKVTLDGHPGREYLMEAPLEKGAEPSKTVMRLFLFDDDIIQIRVVALKPGSDPRDVEAFFKTFRLLDPAPKNK